MNISREDLEILYDYFKLLAEIDQRENDDV